MASPHSARNISYSLVVTINMSSLLKHDCVDSFTLLIVAVGDLGEYSEMLSLTAMCVHHLIKAEQLI